MKSVGTPSIATVGIDVAKAKLDVVLLVAQHKYTRTFPNTAEGFTSLLTWIETWRVDDVHFCLEATGIYSKEIADFLSRQLKRVSVINPRVIRDYRHSWNLRGKTDMLDAALLALYARERVPDQYVPDPEIIGTLKRLMGLRALFTKMHRQLTNRLQETTRDPWELEIEQETGAYLLKKKDEVEAEMKRLIKSDEKLKKIWERLQSVKGIGPTGATALVAFVGDIQRFRNASALVRYVGLSVVEYESGTSVRKKPHMDGQGRGDLRAILYMCAVSAKNHDPGMKAWAESLLARGKPTKVVIVAVMRKLLHIVYGVWKHEKSYDAEKAFPLAA
jgi:transposase